MVTELKPYPEYKDAGVQWLGCLPERWKVRRLRGVAQMLVSNIDKHSTPGEVPVRLCNYVDVYKNERITDRLPFMQATASRDEADAFRLETGDVVITKDSEEWDDIAVPALVEYAASDLVCGYHLAILRPHNEVVSGPYLARALQAPCIAHQFYVAANGVTRYGLSHDAIKSALVTVPPQSEQAAIVRYLDHADRKVRHAIHARQQLIKLLTEQKQAIIQRAVTRGLDPNVRLKPSGVSWLGDIPEHWQVTRLARVVRSSNAGEVIDKGWWGRGKEVLYTCARDPFQSDYPNFPARKRTTGIDLLVTRNGTPYVHRPVADALYSNVVQRINLVPGSNRQYVALSLEEAARSMKGYGVSIESLNYDMWKQLVLVVSPPVEQAAIVQYVDATTVTLDKAIYAARREIDLLREYRTRLIADVVTGKLDVRNVPVSADETDAMPEELESIDDVDAIDQTDDVAEGDSESSSEESA